MCLFLPLDSLKVPIYALESWLGLRFAQVGMYIDLLRECYEAFVIYSFYQLLVTYLGGERELIAKLALKPGRPHVFPFCYLPTWRMSDRFHIEFTDEQVERLQQDLAARGEITRKESKGHDVEQGLLTRVSAVHAAPAASKVGSNPAPDFSAAASSPDLMRNVGSVPEKPVFGETPPRIPLSYLSPYSRPHHSEFLLHTQLGTLQYCIVKPITSLLILLFSLLGVYGTGIFDWASAYPYIAFVNNMSQLWAFYCLVLFYVACKEDLAPLRPVPKFLCVKAVVFFTYWQSMLILMLASLGVLHSTHNYTEDELSVALQDFIVCIEMLVAAVAHHYAFSWRHFHDPEKETNRRMLPALIEAFNVTDVYLQDVRRLTGRSLKKKGKDNHVLSAEEIHRMQYESFVHSQMSGDVGRRSRLAEELTEPLNSDAADDAESASSSSHAGRDAHTTDDAHVATVVREVHVHREQFANGNSTTLVASQSVVVLDAPSSSPAGRASSHNDHDDHASDESASLMSTAPDSSAPTAAPTLPEKKKKNRR